MMDLTTRIAIHLGWKTTEVKKHSLRQLLDLVKNPHLRKEIDDEIKKQNEKVCTICRGTHYVAGQPCASCNCA